MQKSTHHANYLLFVALALAMCASASTATDVTFPKIIAPDLVIESAEQGEFLDDPADPRHFKPSDKVGKKCGLFGWRMRVKTSRARILIQERGANKGEPDALPIQREPKYGYLYSAVNIVQGVPAGNYSSTVYVENVSVKTFTMIVK
jgi:hypothetical protein